MSAKLPRVEIGQDYCKGCELCVTQCPQKVLEMSPKFNVFGYNFATYKGDGCIGCGICYYACPEPEAITVFKKEKEEKKN